MKINRVIETAIYCDNVQEMFDFYQKFPGIEVIAKYLPRSVFLRA